MADETQDGWGEFAEATEPIIGESEVTPGITRLEDGRLVYSDTGDPVVESWQDYIKNETVENRALYVMGAIELVSLYPNQIDPGWLAAIATVGVDKPVADYLRDTPMIDGRPTGDMTRNLFSAVDEYLETYAPQEVQNFHQIWQDAGNGGARDFTMPLAFGTLMAVLPYGRAMQLGLKGTAASGEVLASGRTLSSASWTQRLAVANKTAFNQFAAGGLVKPMPVPNRLLAVTSAMSGRLPSSILQAVKKMSFFTAKVGGPLLAFNMLSNYLKPEQFDAAEVSNLDAAMSDMMPEPGDGAYAGAGINPLYGAPPGIQALGGPSGGVSAQATEGRRVTGGGTRAGQLTSSGFQTLEEAMAGDGEVAYGDNPYVGYDGEYQTESDTVPKYADPGGAFGEVTGSPIRKDVHPSYQFLDIRATVNNLSAADFAWYQGQLIRAGYVDPDTERYIYGARNEQDYVAMTDLMARANRHPNLGIDWRGALSEQVRVAEENKGQPAGPFIRNAYIKPDPETYNKYVKDWSKSTLGREANDWEVTLGRNSLLGWDKQKYDNMESARYQDWLVSGRETEWDPPAGVEPEEWEIFQQTAVQDIDLDARFAKLFEGKFKDEMSRNERTALVHGKTQNLMTSLNRMSEAFRR